MSDKNSPHEQLWELIHDIKFAMFAARSSDGEIRSRPLTTQNKIDEGGVLWFFVSKSSELVQDLRTEPQVNVSYADPGDDSYVSVAGTATLSEDRAKVEELFTPMAKAWFTQGPNDPDLQLVQVRIDQAEYWDVKESKVTQLFKMAKSAVTGQPPSGMGEHRELDFGTTG
ncbi:MAG: ral stress protein [Rhizobacter sp.]|nr:ral stress protein [Rhizobacter sp.]